MKDKNHFSNFLIVALVAILAFASGYYYAKSSLAHQAKSAAGFIAAPLSGGVYDERAITADVDVYICPTPTSHAYHTSANCEGLRRCSRNPRKIKLSSAKEMGRTPCHFCH